MLNRKSVKIVDTSHLMKRYSKRQSELQRRQRTYRKDLEHRDVLKRDEILLVESYKDMVKKMRSEKDTLKAQIWTATGKSHITQNSQALGTIKCLIDCYIALCDEVQHTKISLTNLSHTISIVDKELLNLNMFESKRSKNNMEKAVKELRCLEDDYENMVQLECKMNAKNERLRHRICELLNERGVYNSLYTKYIQRLNEGKKYLTDTIDYALNQIEMVIDVHEKIEQNNKHYSLELEKRKTEAHQVRRKHLSNMITFEFQKLKNARRQLQPISEKIVQRRERVRTGNLMKLRLYNDILHKIREYTNSYDIRSVIIRFQEQESLYYSYFNYANELGYRITLLNNSVANLFQEIHILKLSNRDKQRDQKEYIDNLEVILQDKRANNAKLRKMSESQDERIGKLFEALQLIRDQSRTDTSTLMNTFNFGNEINLINMREQMKLLEKRIYSIVCATYMLERQNDDHRHPVTYTVKQLDKVIEFTTPLDDIVLTTQCAECAETDARNLDNDGAVITNIKPIRHLKKIIAEKVIQPDMQYRLHCIKNCRLPRSRYLAHRQDVG